MTAMRCLFFLALCLTATILVSADQPIKVHGRTPPPYYSPDNNRIERSANPEPQGSISIQAQKPLNGPDRRPTYNVDYQHQIWKNKHGSISASGGAVKVPGQKVQGSVGIQGTWRFKG